MAYKRVLIKISGEQLAGKYESGIDPDLTKWYAAEIKKAVDTGVEIVLVVGGGNMVRGEVVAGKGIKRVTGDHMGMLSGLINAIAVTDIFEANGLSVRCLSNIFADQVAEMYSYRRAMKHLRKGRIVIVSGGIGRPYFTHDTASVNLALELECEAVLKATKVDGVYDKDPMKHKDAVKYDSLGFQEAVQNQEIKVMDKAAIGLAMDQGMKVVVFNPMNEDAIKGVVQGKDIGTTIS